MKILTPEHPDFATACLAWNRAVTKKPAIIAFCDVVEELPTLLAMAKQSQLPLHIRSGRHHYEGASSGDDAFVIDLSKLQTIAIDETLQTVTIAGGVRNRELYEALALKGYPFPGGGCPTVGVAGFTTGGGWGYSARLFGLGCDSLQSVRLLTFAGELLQIDADHYPDIFWALRGGGTTHFGIITELTYQLPPKKMEATRIFLDFHFETAHASLPLLEWYQTWFPKTPNWFNAKIAFYRQSPTQFGVKITGMAYASASAVAQLLAHVLTHPNLVTTDCQTGPVIEANRWIQDHHPEYESYKSGGRFIETALTSTQWQTLAIWLTNAPTEAQYVAFTLYGLGGAIRDLSHDATAFAFRQMNFIFGAQIVWESEFAQTSCQNWLIHHWPAIEGFTSGSFYNFAFQPQSEANYYGNHWQRFQTITKKFTN
ncbi:MAG: FAD-binding oxidoreductase [Culicoidibacterales bacterium]